MVYNNTKMKDFNSFEIFKSEFEHENRNMGSPDVKIHVIEVVSRLTSDNESLQPYIPDMNKRGVSSLRSGSDWCQTHC